MSDRISKKEFVKILADRMNTDEQTAALWIGAVVDILYESFKAGRSVALMNFGNFYIKPKRQSTVFRFNPSQKLRALFGWSSNYKRKL